MTRFGPILPLVGAATRFQPVYVDDVAAAAVKGVTGEAAAGIYELGGPEVASFRELVNEMLAVIQRQRLVVGLPFWLGNILGSLFELGQTMTGGLAPAQITRDQVKSLKSDNIVSGDHPGLAALGIDATAMEAILPEYLWRFRPSGQYAEIKQSATHLRKS